MKTAAPLVIMVDAYSTGQFFAPRLRARGCRVVQVTSRAQLSPALKVYFEDAKEKYGALYDGWLVFDGHLETLVAQVRPYHPAAVIAGAETGVELADALAHALGLPGNDPRRSAARRDKVKMQQALQCADVPAMQFHEAGGLEDLLGWARALNRWPVVVKPVRSAATEGLHFCRDIAELETAWHDLTARPNLFGDANRSVLAEECLEGTEYVVNTVTAAGTHYLSDFWQYRKIRLPGVAAIYDYVRLLPYPAPGHPLRPLVDYTFRALDALGIVQGPAHSEVMLTDAGPRLIETGARVMGGSLSPDLLVECIGHSQVDWSIDCHLDPAALRQAAAAPYQRRQSLMAKMLISRRAGRLREIPALQLLVQLPSVHRANLLHTFESWQLDQTVDLLSSPGMVILKHEKEEVLMADYQTIADLEQEAQEQLFEMEEDRPNPPGPEEWYRQLPDALWLKDETAGEADAALICACLDLKAGQEVLDCPCGDGRVGLHLARRGLRLVGVDLNPRFVARARTRFAQAGLPGEFLEMDMRKINFPGRFDAVLNWFNSFGYFSREEDWAVLRRLAAALKPGGHLLLEAPARRAALKNVRHLQHAGATLPPHWNKDAGVMELAVPVSAEAPPVCIRDRLYTLGEYRLLMRASGLAVQKVFDESGNSFGPASHRMVILARKPG